MKDSLESLCYSGVFDPPTKTRSMGRDKSASKLGRAATNMFDSSKKRYSKSSTSDAIPNTPNKELLQSFVSENTNSGDISKIKKSEFSHRVPLQDIINGPIKQKQELIFSSAPKEIFSPPPPNPRLSTDQLESEFALLTSPSASRGSPTTHTSPTALISPVEPRRRSVQKAKFFGDDITISPTGRDLIAKSTNSPAWLKN
jgi:hypothetical protein